MMLGNGASTVSTQESLSPDVAPGDHDFYANFLFDGAVSISNVVTLHVA